MRVTDLLGATVCNDVRRRLAYYKSDWKDGVKYSYR